METRKKMWGEGSTKKEKEKMQLDVEVSPPANYH